MYAYYTVPIFIFLLHLLSPVPRATMKPLLLHPCFIFISLLISINIPTCLCEDDSRRYTNCGNAFSCGNSISKIKYPFWGGNRDRYCGESEYENLTCEGEVPKIIINDIKYRILDWKNTTQILTVARDDYWSNSVCVSDYKNSTFDKTLFQYVDDGLVNVTFFYNCSANSNRLIPTNLFNTSCDGGDVFYAVGPLPSYTGSCKIVVIPIFQTSGSLVSSNRISDALNGGFELKGTGNYDQCKTCTDSGGECGSDGGKFQCFCKDGPRSNSCKGKKWSLRLKFTVGATAGAAVAGVLICMTILCLRYKSATWQGNFGLTSKSNQNVEAFLKSHGALSLRRYKLSDVKKMTNNLKVKLGQGGFGAVYKGELLNGSPVAVKILNASKRNGEDFINEVASIGRTSHVNIVSLLGFCLEGNKKALIYEFMPNGSLDKFIYSKGLETTKSLSWDNLWQIAIGIARGLEYLHRGCNTRILHFDIKPHNILLDENFCPKISDFGLAKLCPRKESIISMSDARGTIGYVAPEVWNRHFGGISHKSDVYSYGMMLLEMVGVRENINVHSSHTSETYFPDWIYNRLEQGKDLRTDGQIGTEEKEIPRRMTIVGLWCVQTFPKDRPTMSKVIDMLQDTKNSQEMPPKPVLSSPPRLVLESTTSSSQLG